GPFPSVVTSGVSLGVIKPGSSPGQIARPGPARAGLSRLRPTFQRTASRDTPATVISAGAGPWESASLVAATRAQPWEALLLLASIQCSAWEPAGFFAPPVTTTFGVRGMIAARSPGQIGSPGPARAGLTRLRPQYRLSESASRDVSVSTALTIPWASAGVMAQTALGPWEAGTNQTAAATTFLIAWES